METANPCCMEVLRINNVCEEKTAAVQVQLKLAHTNRLYSTGATAVTASVVNCIPSIISLRRLNQRDSIAVSVT